MPTRILEAYECCRCKEMKPREAFGTRKCKGKNGEGERRYRLTRCHQCEAKRVKEKAVRHPHTASERRRRRSRKEWEDRKLDRANLVRIERFIVADSRKSDRKKGLKNDLTVSGVAEIISKPCVYCGETEIRMTLDRIDNEIGHVFANVVGACVRCNLIRRHMPFAAWMRIAPVIRQAREEGLFQGWTGEIHRKGDKRDLGIPDLIQSIAINGVQTARLTRNDVL